MLNLLKNLRKPTTGPAGPWIDRQDALALADASSAPETHKAAARDLIKDGFTVLRGAINPDLCQQVIEDYHRYVAENAGGVNFDAQGRERRLLQFHWWSDASMRIATDPDVMALLDFIFGQRASPYSSLTFKYGTQQEIHRDTPHFATWPRSQFVGVWTALEDIDPTSGPLQYVRGAHRYDLPPEAVLAHVRAKHTHLTPAQQLDRALYRYNDQVELHSAEHGELTLAPLMKRGDVAIWHAELPHGGSPASDPMRSRWSMVVHCTPEAVQGHEYQAFFTHDGPEPPADRYTHREAYGRKVAFIGDPIYATQ
jgi:ectoine hydroxylase-related dioxygenase (phytanoyl-CoA dioxygenase family)